MLPSGRAFYCMARGWMENPVFSKQPHTEREAWVWLIEAAAYQPETQRIDGDAIAVGRGEFAASVRYLAKAWKWDQSKVRRFLRRLTDEGMISTRIDTPRATPRTVVRLCKYDEYQLAPGARDTLSDTPPTHLATHPNDTPSKVQNPRQLRMTEDAGEDSDTPPRHTSRHKKANKALKKGGLETAAAEGSEGEAVSLQNQGQGNPDLARQMVAAFVEARNETFGRLSNDTGGRGDYVEANRVAAAGLTLDDFKAVLAVQLPRLKARGQDRPRSLAMFARDFDARVAEKQRRAAERQADPERDQWLPKMLHYSGTGQWLSAWGAAPGTPGCEMPERLQREVLASRGRAAA